MMRRREFITLLGGGRRRGRSRRARSRASGCGASACCCRQPRTIRNRQAGWRRSCRAAAIGLDRRRNVRIDIRWAAGDPDALRRYAAELVALAPDVILASGRPLLRHCCRRPARVPVVFVQGHRSGRRRFRRKPGAAGRQRHRIYAVRIRYERKMAGAAQGGRAGPDTRGSPSRCRIAARNRPVRRNPVGGAIAQAWRSSPIDMRDAGRDRARRRGVRPRAQMAA